MAVKLSSEEIDHLRELGNIGAGHATTALSELTNQRLMMSVPNVNQISTEKLWNLEGISPEELVAYITAPIKGDLSGVFNVIIPSQSAEDLVKVLLKRSVENLRLLDDMGLSLLNEIGSIMMGSFFTSMVDMLGLNLELGAPQLAVDMLNSSMGSVATEMNLETDIVFVIETKVFPEGKVINLHFLLMLDNVSILLLLEKLKAILHGA